MESCSCTFSGYFSEHAPQQPTIGIYLIHAAEFSFSPMDLKRWTVQVRDSVTLTT
jgi:hypothetical protein